MNQTLTKLICMLKTYINQKYQLLINKRKIQALSTLMIEKPLLNIRMIWMIFIKILKNTNKKRKILIISDDVIADMLSNKKRNIIVTELFIG